MHFNQILKPLLNDTNMAVHFKDGIPDFIPPDCPHQKIGVAYDKTAGQYDSYITGENFFLKILKKIALGLDKEAETECKRVINKMLSRMNGEGTVLDIPAGTGLFTFEEYVKKPEILFIAAEYSWGMLKQAQQKIKRLNAKNILLVRADVGSLPFKNESFDALICLNGIHSFPEKEKAISQMSGVLKKDGSIHGSLVLRGERWLTDLIMETAYYRLLWFTRPALSRGEFLTALKKHGLEINSFITIGPAATFEASKGNVILQSAG